MPHKWSRDGKISYGDVPKCDWRRRMANNGKKIVRLIQHKGKVILQKTVLLGAEDEQQQQEEKDQEQEGAAAEEAEEEADEPPPPAKDPSKATEGQGQEDS